MSRILVVDDDETLRMTLGITLKRQGYDVEMASDGAQALEQIKAKGPYDFLLLDVNMPVLSGMDVLSQVKELHPSTVVIILTAYTNVQDAVNAIKNGAYDYLEKPVQPEQILKLLDDAKQALQMVEIASFSAPQLNFDQGRTMIGKSRSMTRVYDLVYKLSKVDTSVLIRGESGTGKELVARALHLNSHRKKGPFVAVNCAAIPENLIESELFGHEKGAFTGADKKKVGKFQFAHNGTIFLDEIGDVTAQMQVKLLRVLQEKRFVPVGANQEVGADVRIIAATNRPLEKMIADGEFRSDLFYRLNVLPIHLPPLRDRKDDIPSLAQFMIKKFNKVHSRSISEIDEQAMRALQSYPWPGNIRELENVIEHAFIIESSNCIHRDSLPEHVQVSGKTSLSAVSNSSDDTSRIDAPTTNASSGESSPQNSALIPDQVPLNYPALKEQFEREFIIKALQAYHGRINQTAEHTQMTKVTLLRKLEKYGINPKDYHLQPS